MNLNKVILIGGVTFDPELRAMPNGQKVCNFSIATNQRWEGGERTEFHSVVVFGKLADTVAEYVKKGQKVAIEGRIQTRSWDKDGEKKYKTEIVAENIQF